MAALPILAEELSTADLIDLLLSRLGLEDERGRIEIEFERGKARKLWRHLVDVRSDVVLRFDRLT